MDFHMFSLQNMAPLNGACLLLTALILKDKVVSEQDCIWPYAMGKVKGHAIQPLYPKQILAAQEDGKLYDMLALIDAIRVGKIREKNIAIELLTDYLSTNA